MNCCSNTFWIIPRKILYFESFDEQHAEEEDNDEDIDSDGEEIKQRTIVLNIFSISNDLYFRSK